MKLASRRLKTLEAYLHENNLSFFGRKVSRWLTDVPETPDMPEFTPEMRQAMAEFAERWNQELVDVAWQPPDDAPPYWELTVRDPETGDVATMEMWEVSPGEFGYGSPVSVQIPGTDRWLYGEW